jgi:hypothetical protein
LAKLLRHSLRDTNSLPRIDASNKQKHAMKHIVPV